LPESVPIALREELCKRARQLDPSRFTIEDDEMILRWLSKRKSPREDEIDNEQAFAALTLEGGRAPTDENREARGQETARIDDSTTYPNFHPRPNSSVYHNLSPSAHSNSLRFLQVLPSLFSKISNHLQTANFASPEGENSPYPYPRSKPNVTCDPDRRQRESETSHAEGINFEHLLHPSLIAACRDQFSPIWVDLVSVSRGVVTVQVTNRHFFKRLDIYSLHSKIMPGEAETSILNLAELKIRPRQQRNVTLGAFRTLLADKAGKRSIAPGSFTLSCSVVLNRPSLVMGKGEVCQSFSLRLRT